MASRLFQFITPPFTKNHHHLFSLFVLIASIDVMFFIQGGTVVYAAYIGASEFLLSYLLTLLYSVFPVKIMRKVYLFLVYVLALVYFELGLFSITSMDSRALDDFMVAVLDTNPSEASEFVSTFYSAKVVLIGVKVPIVLVLVNMVVKRYEIIQRRVQLAGIAIIIGCTCMMAHNPSVWNDGVLGTFYPLVSNESYPDLTQIHTNPQISQNGSLPKNVVIVIGESEMKQHCSLYGYERTTTPKMELLRDDSLLYVYSNVTSPAINTPSAFKCILNTYRPEYKDSPKWYECTNVFEVLHLLGYKSFWLSNQSKHGLYDNLVGRFSELCDTAVFAGNKFAGMARGDSYDGELVPMAEELLSSADSLRFMIVHLMGSHEAFQHRYPPTYVKYVADDYLQYPQEQRLTRARYDNSILYNDYVVTEIMKLFSDKEGIVFLLFRSWIGCL